MKKKARRGAGRRRFVILAAVALLAAWPAGSQSITLTSSDWDLTVGVGDLTGGAGTDFNPTYRVWTASDANIIVTTGSASPWAVTAGVRLPGGQSWPVGVSVYTYLTNIGTCFGTCGGAQFNGTVGALVGPLPTLPSTLPFFDGRRNRSGVLLSLRIEGLTASIAAGTYQIEVVYTIN